MAKNIKIEGKTLEQIMDSIKEAVTKYQLTDSAPERLRLRMEAEKLRDEYNKTSKLTAYAACLEAENPMLTLIQTYTYNVVSVGTDKKTDTLSVKTETSKGEKLSDVFNLWDFVETCKSVGVEVTAASDWKIKAVEAQKTLIENVRKYITSGGAKDVKALKDALQAMFDAVVKIEGKTGGNAVRATSKQVRTIYMTCGSMNFRTLEATFGRDSVWQKHAFAYMHAAVTGKEYTYVYGGSDAAAETAEEAAETKTEE